MPSDRPFYTIFSTLTSLISLFLIPTFATSLDINGPLISSEGNIPFKYQGKAYQTHYKVFGNIFDKTRTPVVVLHGGPGLSYDYLSPFSDLSTIYKTPVILYDQLGNGRSTHLQSAPPSFWTIDLFVNELANLINYFSIEKRFDIAGHSWGSILGMEYAVRRQPKGLRHLVLSDGLASSDLWDQSTAQLLQEFPPWVAEGMMAGMSEPSKFQAALLAFYAVHGNRVVPIPADYNATLQWLFGPNGDGTVASVPILNGWTIIDRLTEIKPQTLVINSRWDISQDFVIQPLVDKIPKVKWIKFDNSSHMPFWEERNKYFREVGEFLSN